MLELLIKECCSFAHCLTKSCLVGMKRSVRNSVKMSCHYPSIGHQHLSDHNKIVCHFCLRWPQVRWRQKRKWVHYHFNSIFTFVTASENIHKYANLYRAWLHRLWSALEVPSFLEVVIKAALSYVATLARHLSD